MANHNWRKSLAQSHRRAFVTARYIDPQELKSLQKALRSFSKGVSIMPIPSTKKLPEPCARRELLRQRIISAIQAEFGEEEMYQLLFFEAMWLAMQSVCGPAEAAAVIRESQIHP
ncbi:hypothetical protein VI609_20835 [Klebsiella pneumoniae]|nr:hypothetical protein [Klebsiella pneumoniae]WMW97841.1 hypothetical protein RG051_09900 [Klebsiella pneumoniae]WRO69696.1 hypothetical protein VI609_20835 [Klebsiella pneumoniae]